MKPLWSRVETIMDNSPTDFSRRKLLVGAAALAASAPLAAGLAAGQASATQAARPANAPSGNPKASGTAVTLTDRRTLGKLEVSSVGLGVQNMHRTYQTTVPYRPEMINIIRSAFEQGVTFFDCAEAYGPHENERILGEAIAPFRDNVVITSKFGWNIDLETGVRGPGLNSRPERIKRAVEGMLKRLHTDRIDLLYQHRVDPQVPIEDVAGAIKGLMDQGKVLHWGLSEPGIQTIRRAHAALPLTAIQNEYSMATRYSEKEVIPLCEELGIGFVPWWPLDCQLLTGWIDANTRFAAGDLRAITPRFSSENLGHNMQLVDLIKAWAVRKQAAPAQIALAWLMAQKPWIVPIPGTTVKDHMLQNIGAAKVIFSDDELRELDAALGSTTVRGERLPPAVLAFSGVEAPKR
jgi:aryl-alcohol dehydrogenase-like predicted oxidoreductase